MTRDEFETRLRNELNLPFYNFKGVNREYSEAEFQQFKADLLNDYLNYVDTYIDSAENDV
jgi:hypothetical protein